MFTGMELTPTVYYVSDSVLPSNSSGQRQWRSHIPADVCYSTSLHPDGMVKLSANTLQCDLSPTMSSPHLPRAQEQTFLFLSTEPWSCWYVQLPCQSVWRLHLPQVIVAPSRLSYSYNWVVGRAFLQLSLLSHVVGRGLPPALP